jgi:hypothetical protein
VEITQARTGRCFCGGVQYEVTGPALAVCICHCESCRRISGGALVPWATYLAKQLRMTQGQLQTFESFPGVTRGHCARCGSSLTYQSARRPLEIDVTLASLGDPPDLAPTFHVWTSDRLGWLGSSDQLPQHPRSATW